MAKPTAAKSVAGGLEELLGEGSEPRELGANQPFRLDAADKTWLVLAGKVEVFAVRLSGAAADGSRTHLVTVEAGEMLFGLRAGKPPAPFGRQVAAEKAPAALLAVPHPGTFVAEPSPAALTRLAREPRHAAVLEAAVEGWVGRLFDRIPRKDVPRSFTELCAGTEVRLAAQEVGRALGGLVWVRHVSGETAFLGRPELTLGAADPLVPIGEDTWLAAAGEALVSCVATAHLLRSGTLWEEMSRFHDLFLRYVALVVAEGEEEERRRLRRRRELDVEILQSASARLASVLETPSGRRAEEAGSAAPTIHEAVDPLLAACRLLGAATGVKIVAPPASSRRLSPEQRLRSLCDASRCRSRKVLLREDWWRQDAGPLLAFLAPEEEKQPKRPVALLPTSPSSYELVDPQSSGRCRVDAELAETLAGDAYMLYPKLPERPLGALDLLRVALRGRQKDLLSILLTGLGGGFLSVLVPVVTAQLFGRVIPGADRPQLLQMTLALLAAAAGVGAFQITRQIAVLRLTAKFDGALQAAVWDRLLALPSGFFRRFTVGDLTTRAMGIDAIRNLLLGNVTTSFLGLVFASTSFVLLFYYSVDLALLATLLIVLLVGATCVLSYFQIRYQRDLRRIEGKIASLVFGLIDGIAKLRTSGAEKRAFALWADRFTEQRQTVLRSRQLANVQIVLNSVYAAFATAALFAMMGLALEEELTISSFLAFSAAFGQVQSAALTFASLVSGLLSIVPIYERLLPILVETPEVDESKAAAGELSGDVELSHVTFRYQETGPQILDDLSLRARPGEFVALVGPSGSGKSTTLRLLLGFEKPETGSIYYDGQDVASLDLQTVRRQIGVVLQNSRPIAGDIYSNIVGGSNLGIEAAWEAAEMAGLAADVKAMPMGMHTVITQGGGTFSGGQVQRLMIARAVVHKPRIIFFDEATSALDNRTQDVVSRSLERLQATRIVVAHRLSTIRNADRIYCMERGRLVEQGTYDELMERSGSFARLAERQIA